MATLFRLPQIFKTWRRDPQGVATVAQDNVTENRNVALLAGKDTFFGAPGMGPDYDWPNPTLPKSRMVSAIFSQTAVWQNRLVNLLAGKDTFFGPPGLGPDYDWPNPTLAKSRIVSAIFSEAQVWQNRLTNLLVGKDTFFRGAGDAPTYDWPNPIRRDPGRLLAAQGFIAPSLLVTLLALTQGPFTPVDQPNPRGALNRIAVGFSVPNLLGTTLVRQDRIYGGPGQVSDYDWPNPRGPFNRIALGYVPQYLFASTLQAPPPGQSLWINPPMRGLQATAVFAGSPLAILSPAATVTTTVHMRGFIVNLGPMTEQI